MTKKLPETCPVRVDVDKHRALKAWAKDRGMLLSAAVREVIEAGMRVKRIQTEEVAG